MEGLEKGGPGARGKKMLAGGGGGAFAFGGGRPGFHFGYNQQEGFAQIPQRNIFAHRRIQRTSNYQVILNFNSIIVGFIWIGFIVGFIQSGFSILPNPKSF